MSLLSSLLPIAGWRASLGVDFVQIEVEAEHTLGGTNPNIGFGRILPAPQFDLLHIHGRPVGSGEP
jgi:hypothetical protein